MVRLLGFCNGMGVSGNPFSLGVHFRDPKVNTSSCLLTIFVASSVKHLFMFLAHFSIVFLLPFSYGFLSVLLYAG